MPRYSELDARPVRATIQALARRIAERFPTSGLLGVAEELLRTADQNEALIAQLRRPIWWLRCASVLGALALLALVAWAGMQIAQLASSGHGSLSDLLQGIDAAVNELIFMSIVLFFLVSLEVRFKRHKALGMLHRLRSLAHVVDMHQLTKDPGPVLGQAERTPSSPERTLSQAQLIRYLDYCSELLSLISKLAALQVQYLQDAVVLDAVTEIESLTAGLSGKIWQKIGILNADASRSASTG
jgi:hypothetical protein